MVIDSPEMATIMALIRTNPPVTAENGPVVASHDVAASRMANRQLDASVVVTSTFPSTDTHDQEGAL